jgi:F-type H+-transporting ATPase subunit gamma
MQSIEALRRKIAGAEDLLDVVKTLKVLAAVNIRHYERAVASLVLYDQTVELGLQALLRQPDVPSLLPLLLDSDDALHQALVVFGSDQGLCGQFNERLTDFCVSEIPPGRDRPTPRRLLAVGERATALLEDAGYAVAGTLGTPSSLAGVLPLVQELLVRIDRWRATEQIGQVSLIYNRPSAGRTYRTVRVPLLPLDRAWLIRLSERPWDSRSLPTFSLSWRDVFAALVQQHLFVALFRACAESLASEDASRLVAMQNAERNIQDRLDTLTAAYHHQRQNAITAELLDIVSGFEAVQQEEVAHAHGHVRARRPRTAG